MSTHTAEYYDQVAAGYDEAGYDENGPYYPANAYRLKLAQAVEAEMPPGRVLDAGCGTGKLLAHLVERGRECAGCDLSAGMLDQARRRVGEMGSEDVPLVQTSLDDLSMFPDASFDHVFCLGVFPYIPEAVEPKCYRELRRVVKPGGHFVTAHENEVFDAFTFNKYTLRFFERNVLPLLGDAAGTADADELTRRLASLVTHPDQPVNTDAQRSGRDIIFTKPENPLTYHDKLAEYGFRGDEILYYHFHALPPLIRNGDDTLMALSREMELRCARMWQGMFLASTFISVARATEP